MSTTYDGETSSALVWADTSYITDAVWVKYTNDTLKEKENC